MKPRWRWQTHPGRYGITSLIGLRIARDQISISRSGGGKELLLWDAHQRVIYKIEAIVGFNK